MKCSVSEMKCNMICVRSYIFNMLSSAVLQSTDWVNLF